MKNLKLFDTESQYETIKEGFEYPTISYVTSTGTVHYTTLRDKCKKEYLTFEALKSGSFTLTIDKDNYGITLDITSVSYSIDNGNNWVTTQRNSEAATIITTPTISQGSKVLWKGIGTKYGAGGPGKGIRSIFSSDCEFIAYGNIHSLTFGDDFINNFTIYQNNYYGLFEGSLLTSAENLVLPATTLADSCYFNMFSGCTSLTTTPVLPATTLANNCYFSMFSGCTSLTTAPVLPATTLTNHCYTSMFSGCTSLTTAPVLPATTLASDCYSGMFYDCTRLNYIKAMFKTTPSTNYTSNWVSGVASTGTFVKNSAATWNVTDVNGIPTGWTVETASA